MARYKLFVLVLLLAFPACQLLLRWGGAAAGGGAGALLGGVGGAAVGGAAGVTAGELAYQELFGDDERSLDDEATLSDVLRVAEQASNAEGKLKKLLFLALGIGGLGMLLGWWGTQKSRRVEKEIKNGRNQG